MLKEKIVELMEPRVGIKKAVKRLVLLTELRNAGFRDLTDRQMRIEISEMVEAGYALGSHNGYGYFIIDSQEDLKIAIQDLESKA